MATIIGTNQNDSILTSGVSGGVTGGTPGAGADSISGLDGNDTLAGGGGNDTIDGGSGTDTADYSGAAAPVSALGAFFSFPGPPFSASGFAVQDGQGGTDTVFNIERVVGSAFNDTIAAQSSSVLNISTASSAPGPVVLVGGSGDDILVGTFGADTIEGGIGNDSIDGGSGSDSLDGGGGRDTYVASNSFFGPPTPGAQVVVDLTTERASSGLDTDTIIGFENVIGTFGNDSIRGDGQDNLLEGRDGNDTLIGGGGNDTLDSGTSTSSSVPGGISDSLDGGDGSDTLRLGSGSFGPNTWTANLALGTASIAFFANPAILALVSIENIISGAGADSLDGDGNANRIDAGDGTDRVDGGAGNDTLTGGGGVDTLRFTAATSGVAVDLNAGTATDGTGGTDSVSGFEVVIATIYNDTLTGGAGAESFAGGDGSDLFLGSGGSDVLDGGFGPGTDTVDYSGLAAPIVLNSTGSISFPGLTFTVFGTLVQKGAGSTDVINGFERLIGSSGNDSINLTNAGAGLSFVAGGNGNDTITASFGFETLEGGIGNDSLFGGDGDDLLDGGAGNDTVDGGNGIDSISFAGVSGPVSINLTTGTGTDGTGGTDLYRNIERVTGSAFDDALTGAFLQPIRATGSLTNATLEGAAGNDTIEGFGRLWNVVSYASSLGAVTVTLGDGATPGSAQDGQGGTDALINVVTVLGSSTAVNTLTGNSADNSLTGGAADDVITGGRGRDSLFGNDGNDTLSVGSPDERGDFLSGGNGNDVLFGSDIASLPEVTTTTLNGGAGNDTLHGFDTQVNRADYNGRTTSVVVDFAAGTATLGSGPGAEVDTLIGILRARGPSLNDTFLGTGGDERFEPGAGNDLVVGGGGDDRVGYTSAQSAVRIDLAEDRASSTTEGEDTLQGIANADGGNFNDLIFGDDAANLLAPLAGNDLVDGRGGEDWVNYGTWFSGTNGIVVNDDPFLPFAGVTVNLALQVAEDNWNFTDRLVSIEHAVGSALSDVLIGAIRVGGEASYLRGLNGNDLIQALRLGTGATADYASDPAGVLVNLSDLDARLGGVWLAGGTARDGWGDTDVLLNIQAVRGSRFDDAMLGSGLGDTLDGGDGNDSLTSGDSFGDFGNLLIGGAGKDLLVATGIGDILDGGKGRGKLRIDPFEGFFDPVEIIRFESRRDSIELHGSDFGLAEGTDLAATGRFVANAAGTATSAPGVGQFVFDTDDRALLWDGDGGGAATPFRILTLDGGDDIAAADIRIIA